MNRHTMQSEVGYLFSGLWKGRGSEGERKQNGKEENGERQKLPLGLGKRKRLRLQAGRKICLSGQGESGQGLSLKGTGQTITSFLTI